MFLLTIISFCLNAFLKRQSAKSNKRRLSRLFYEVYLVNLGIKFEDNRKSVRMSPTLLSQVNQMSLAQIRGT
jgi:hypothetical protein